MAPTLPSLTDLAALPLDRIVVSACCRLADDRLGTVGGMEQKAQAAQQCEPKTVALGVARHQPNTPKNGPIPVIEGETLTGLLSGLCQRLPDIYGPILDLPTGLESDTGSTYATQDFQPFPWLDAKIAEALQRQSQGYIFIEGGPARGKTSWALYWQRASVGVEPGRALPGAAALPALSAWFFARRYGAGNGLNNPYLREENALQTLVSLARLRWGLRPEKEKVRLWTDTESYRYDQHNEQRDDQGKLSTAFQEALAALLKPSVSAEPSTAFQYPSADRPLILLLDGADELWGAGDWTQQPRKVFPEIFPHELPPHVYIVFLSRPGQHLRGQAGVKPILHYQFSADDIQTNITDFLGGAAIRRLSGPKPNEPSFDAEIALILRDPVFQGHVRQASRDSFGYVIGLIRYLSRLSATDCFAELQHWQHEPSSLPQDEYEQRAQELVGLCEALLKDYPISQQVTLRRALVRALASLALLQQSLTAAGLVELTVDASKDSDLATQVQSLLAGAHPLDANLATQVQNLLAGADPFNTNLAAHVQDLLAGVHPFFMPKPPLASTDADKTGHDGSADHLHWLVFDHPLTAELALAYWRLMRLPNRLPDVGEARWKAIGKHAKSVELQRENRLQNTPVDCLAAEAVLHQRIGERSAGYWSVFETQPRPQPVPDARSDAHRYALVWGPFHALCGASQKAVRPYDTVPPSSTAPQALSLLLHAGYLQTVIRVAGADSEKALRQSYIVADEAVGAAENQSLRQRIESTVLEWHSYLVGGSLQVGALLWNLLGGWSLAKDWATRWKESLDQATLVTTLPGVPPDFIRRLHGYNQQALSPCGRWLVTSGTAGIAVWDLRQGAHRMHRVATLADWKSGQKGICCAGVGNTLYLLGCKGQLILTGCIDLLSGEACLAHFQGHKDIVNSVALYADGAGLVGLSSSQDKTIGVLCLTRTEIWNHAAEQATTTLPQPHYLARYAGHTNPVNAVALNAQGQLLTTLSGSEDYTVGVLCLTHAEVRNHIAEQAITDEPESHRLARYAGHTKSVNAVALHAQGETLTVLSGSKDYTVGVLCLTRSEVWKHAAEQITTFRPQPYCLARYAGHTNSVNAVALHAQGEALIALSGSWDETVGVLCLTRAEVQNHSAEQIETFQLQPQTHCVARYAGHTNPVDAVALHVQGETITTFSGSGDEIIGVLNLNRKGIVEGAEEQAQSKQPDFNRLRRFSTPIQYRWCSEQGLAMGGNKDTPIFWGIGPQAIAQATVKVVAEKPPQILFRSICPFHEPNFIPHDIAQLDEHTLVVGGASGNDVALLLLEWVRPV